MTQATLAQAVRLHIRKIFLVKHAVREQAC